MKYVRKRSEREKERKKKAIKKDREEKKKGVRKSGTNEGMVKRREIGLEERKKG